MTRRRWVLFFATWGLVSLMTRTTPESAHELSRLGTIESLVERHTYQLDESGFADTLDKIFRDGHWYSHQPPLLPMLQAPVYWALRITGARFNNSGREPMVFLFTVLTNGLALALIALTFSFLFEMAGLPSPAREIDAFLLPLGTWLFPYSVVNNSHGISALLITVAAYLLLSIEWRGVARSRCLWLGAALGLVSAIELLPLVSFVPLTLWYLWRRGDLDSGDWRAFATAFAIPIAVQSLINIPITGDVIPAGFHHELFNYPGSAFDASSLTGTLKHRTVAEWADYSWRALFVYKGYFTFAPLLLFGLIVAVSGWGWWARARRVQLVLLGSVALSIAASLSTTNNFGGGAVGFRHATYLAPAILTLLLPVLANHTLPRLVVVPVAVVSIALMVMFVVPQPWSVVAWPAKPVTNWAMYFPVVAKLVRGTLLVP